MREIIFRGKRVDNGKWVHGTLNNVLDEAPKIQYVVIKHGMMFLTVFNVIPETVGQYTGLKDVHGTRIFEGDIIHVEQCGETGSRISTVYFGEYIDADSVFDNYCCIGFYVKTSDGCCTIGALLSEEFECEVIGNIHDNPELMGGNTNG